MGPIELLRKAREAYRVMNRRLDTTLHLFATQTIPKYREPGHLEPHGYRVYSQNEEDGIIAEILRRIECERGHFVEIGVGDGMENNTLALLLRRWTGAWIEGSERMAALIRERFSRLIESGRLRLKHGFVDASNVESYLEELAVPQEPGLLSIDIDGNDYYVWKAIESRRPKVVVIEYNAALGPTADAKVPYDPARVWDRTRAFGASLKALELLGRQKGYDLVACNFTGINAFFVRNDLTQDRFRGPFTSEVHFEPPRYHLELYAGHRADPSEIREFFD